LRQLPVERVTEMMQDPCGVCLEPIRKGMGIRRLPCLHVFHARCIERWLLEKPTCPLDNRPLSELCAMSRGEMDAFIDVDAAAGSSAMTTPSTTAEALLGPSPGARSVVGTRWDVGAPPIPSTVVEGLHFHVSPRTETTVGTSTGFTDTAVELDMTADAGVLSIPSTTAEATVGVSILSGGAAEASVGTPAVTPVRVDPEAELIVTSASSVQTEPLAAALSTATSMPSTAAEALLGMSPSAQMTTIISKDFINIHAELEAGSLPSTTAKASAAPMDVSAVLPTSTTPNVLATASPIIGLAEQRTGIPDAVMVGEDATTISTSTPTSTTTEPMPGALVSTQAAAKPLKRKLILHLE